MPVYIEQRVYICAEHGTSISTSLSPFKAVSKPP